MQSLWRDAGSGVETVRLTEPDEVNEMVRLFERVAQEQGWQPEGALRRWLERSVYFGLHVPDEVEKGKGHFIGGLQLVRPDALGRLPCHDVWPEVRANSSSRSTGRTAHVAMLAVEAAYRGQSRLFWSLAVEMWRHCVGENISTLYIEVTPRVLPLYRRLGWPLNLVGEARPHWGEACYLCTLGIPEVAQALLQRAEYSPYYRQIVAQALRVAMIDREEGPLPGADLEECRERCAA